jgi:hypothetical protein
MDKLRAQVRIERLSIPEPNSGCWLFLGATKLGYGQLRNYKTGKDESGTGHGWHDLTNAPLPPPAQSEPNTGEPATERSIIWFAFPHGDQLSPGGAQFVESLGRTPLSDKQRVWLHDIVAKIEPTRGSFRARRRGACGLSSSKNARTQSSGRPGQNQGAE